MTRLISVVALSCLVACGGVGKKNVEACQGYVDSLSCGDFDFSSLYPDDFCNGYEETTCDVSEYFDCLANGASCDEETGIYTPATDCTIPTCE